MPPSEALDPEDILSSSLHTLYDYQPIILSSAGSSYTYISKAYPPPSTNDAHKPLTVTLQTPDTHAANWALHASSIWVSSLYLADHLDYLHIDEHITANPPGQSVRVLELGAAAGLPGILLAKMYKVISVTVSDYPDEELINTLSENVRCNGVSDNCQALPYAWGSDTSTLLRGSNGFDVVLAADTLWNPALHSILIETLQLTLNKSRTSRAHFVAGLHTGRYTIQSFLDTTRAAGFYFESILEKEVGGSGERAWEMRENENEDERERRRWVIWMTLRWKHNDLE